jgi:hypothetical protein
MGYLPILCIIVKISVAQGYRFLIETTQMGKEKRKQKCEK